MPTILNIWRDPDCIVAFLNSKEVPVPRIEEEISKQSFARLLERYSCRFASCPKFMPLQESWQEAGRGQYSSKWRELGSRAT